MQELSKRDWGEVHALMVARDFPDVPPTLAGAVPFFGAVQMYGRRGPDGRLGVVWVLGRPQDGAAFLDVVCARGWQGRWATAKVLGALYTLAFGQMHLRCLWVQPRNKTALRAALAAGFVPGTPLDVAEPVLVMTPYGVPKKWMQRERDMKEKESEDGKFVW